MHWGQTLMIPKFVFNQAISVQSCRNRSEITFTWTPAIDVSTVKCGVRIHWTRWRISWSGSSGWCANSFDRMALPEGKLVLAALCGFALLLRMLVSLHSYSGTICFRSGFAQYPFPKVVIKVFTISAICYITAQIQFEQGLGFRQGFEWLMCLLLARGRCVAQIRRLWSATALDGNHRAHSHQGVVRQHYRQRSSLLGSRLPPWRPTNPGSMAAFSTLSILPPLPSIPHEDTRTPKGKHRSSNIWGLYQLIVGRLGSDCGVEGAAKSWCDGRYCHRTFWCFFLRRSLSLLRITSGEDLKNERGLWAWFFSNQLSCSSTMAIFKYGPVLYPARFEISICLVLQCTPKMDS